jgi:hypothetical protein
VTYRTSAARVIYVHGTGPQPSPADLKRRLDEALFGADQGERTAVAYYADVLHPNGVAETVRALAEVIPSLPSQMRGEPAPLVDELVREADPNRPDASASVTRMATIYASRVVRQPAAEAQRDSSAAALLPRAVRALLFRLVVRFLLRDANAYFFEGSAGPIRERVRRVLDDSDTPAILIGHSLGSVVAYDVLSDPPGRPRDVPLFVTVGSPLGIDAVKELVHQPPVVPPGVAAWLNASDPLDVVAADPEIRDDYGGSGQIRDLGVFNPAWFPHDLAGYLSTPEIREAVARRLADAGIAGFVSLW